MSKRDKAQLDDACFTKQRPELTKASFILPFPLLLIEWRIFMDNLRISQIIKGMSNEKDRIDLFRFWAELINIDQNPDAMEEFARACGWISLAEVEMEAGLGDDSVSITQDLISPSLVNDPFEGFPRIAR